MNAYKIFFLDTNAGPTKHEWFTDIEVAKATWLPLFPASRAPGAQVTWSEQLPWHVCELRDKDGMLVHTFAIREGMPEGFPISRPYPAEG